MKTPLHICIIITANIYNKKLIKQMNHKIKILRRELPHGAIGEIVTRMGGKYTYRVVAAAIRGDVFKQDVFDCAIAYLEELKAKERELVEMNTAKIKRAIAS